MVLLLCYLDNTKWKSCCWFLLLRPLLLGCDVLLIRFMCALMSSIVRATHNRTSVITHQDEDPVSKLGADTSLKSGSGSLQQHVQIALCTDEH